MSSRNKTLVAIYLLMFSIIAAFYLNVITGPGKTDDATSTSIFFTPFNSNDVWGAKVETADGSSQFFAGIQKRSAALGENVINGLTQTGGASTDERIQNSQFLYKIEFARFDIILKMLSYNHPRANQERNDSTVEGELKHLNYIVENNSCSRRGEDDVVLLDQKNASDFGAPNMEVPLPKSVFGLLIQIDLK